MKFQTTGLPGVLLIEPERLEDNRGFFARTWCRDEFARQGLEVSFTQCSISYNGRAGTLRGMHLQGAPHEEVKLVRCTQGAVYDVVLDLRRDSPTFKQWAGFELSASNRHALYIPKGCAHGFQTLTDDAELLYHISEPYHPALAMGVRWDDPTFAIRWPEASHRIISPRDTGLPDFGG